MNRPNKLQGTKQADDLYSINIVCGFCSSQHLTALDSFGPVCWLVFVSLSVKDTVSEAACVLGMAETCLSTGSIDFNFLLTVISISVCLSVLLFLIKKCCGLFSLSRFTGNTT